MAKFAIPDRGGNAVFLSCLLHLEQSGTAGVKDDRAVGGSQAERAACYVLRKMNRTETIEAAGVWREYSD